MVNIQLDESVVAALSSLASEQGQSIEEYLGALATKEAEAKKRLTAAEVIASIKSASVPSKSTYAGTYPREDIYVDHD
jgi:hypothetical protein